MRRSEWVSVLIYRSGRWFQEQKWTCVHFPENPVCWGSDGLDLAAVFGACGWRGGRYGRKAWMPVVDSVRQVTAGRLSGLWAYGIGGVRAGRLGHALIAQSGTVCLRSGLPTSKVDVTRRDSGGWHGTLRITGDFRPSRASGFFASWAYLVGFVSS